MSLARAKSAMLFDMDGTLVITDHLHKIAFEKFLTTYNIALADGEFERLILGRSNQSIMRHYFPSASDADLRRYAEEKECIFREIALGRVEPTRGAVRFVEECYGFGIKMCVVTNAPRANALFLLDALGILAAFDHLVIADELSHGKPHPAPYLQALHRLQIHSTDSLAFEDSLAGIQSADAAGIEVVGLSTSLEAVALQDCGAVHTMPNFIGFSLASPLLRGAASRVLTAL